MLCNELKNKIKKQLEDLLIINFQKLYIKFHFDIKINLWVIFVKNLLKRLLRKNKI